MTKALQQEVVSPAIREQRVQLDQHAARATAHPNSTMPIGWAVVGNGKQTRTVLLPGRIAGRALPVVELGRRRPDRAAPDAKHGPCPEHGEHAITHCVKCNRPICSRCAHLLINHGAWCLSCGRRYRSALLRTLIDLLVFVAKLGVLAGIVAAIMTLPPVPLVVRGFGAVLVVVVLGSFFFLGYRAGDPDVREVKPRRRAFGTSA